MSEIELEIKTVSQYVIKVGRYIADLKDDIRHISERLRFNTGHRDPSAHRRAYQDLSRTVREFLRKIPEVPMERPQPDPREVKNGNKKVILPFVIKNDFVFMGCSKCTEWIDVTNVFSKHIFDGCYSCINGHEVFFGGLEDKSKED